MLNFSALVPNSWKSGLIRGMLHRAKKICSSEELFQREVDKLSNLFALNGYPKMYFDTALEKFLASLQVVTDSVNLDDDAKKTDRKYIFGIPYVGKISRDYKNKISSLVKEHLQEDIFSYFSSCKVSSYFSLKSKVPFALKARIVYKFTCLSDSDISYIGETKRHLAIRAKEHLNPKGSHNSEIKKHIFDCDSCKKSNLSVNKFKILKQCKDEYATRVNEAILIKKCLPKLNKQMFRKGQSYLLRVF